MLHQSNNLLQFVGVNVKFFDLNIKNGIFKKYT